MSSRLEELSSESLSLSLGATAGRGEQGEERRGERQSFTMFITLPKEVPDGSK